MEHQKDLFQFIARNVDAMNMLVHGFDDYVASRACLQVNCICQAAVLGEQAVEKMFKGGLRLSGDATRFKDLGHDLVKIAQMLETYGWFKTSCFEELIEALKYHFDNTRYPPTTEDNDYLTCREGISLSEFDQLDEVVVSYMDVLPVPDEIRLGLGVYGELLNLETLAICGLPSHRWKALTWGNKALEERVAAMVTAIGPHREVVRGLPIPNLLPAGLPEAAGGERSYRVLTRLIAKGGESRSSDEKE